MVNVTVRRYGAMYWGDDLAKGRGQDKGKPSRPRRFLRQSRRQTPAGPEETAKPMPNLLALAALIVWPVGAWALFRLLPFERALIWSILGAYLLLPPVANFDFPLIPPLDKSSIPNLTAFFIVTFVLGRKIPIFSGSPTIRLLLILFIASPIATTVLNGDPLEFAGDFFIPGLPITDALAEVVKQTIFLLPFFLGRQFLRTEAAQREILIALVLGCLAYSLPMLVEIRLSPQINVWIYGFFPHEFGQQIRFGGFRPVVFLIHGLFVAFFTLTAVIAAFGLWRSEPRGRRAPFFWSGVYLTGILVLCKTVGVLVYAVLALPAVLLAGRRTQIIFSGAIAAVVLLYPLLRGTDLIPVQAMVTKAAEIQAERAQSLDYRLRNESEVLAHAQERPIFGWGGFGRNFARDPVTGDTDTVLDGRWIIVISTFGWCGYIVEFGLLALPLVMLAWRSRGIPAARLSPYAGPLALILAFNMFDLLPNSPLTPFTWLLAGALLGHAEALARRAAPAHRSIVTVLP